MDGIDALARVLVNHIEKEVRMAAGGAPSRLQAAGLPVHLSGIQPVFLPKPWLARVPHPTATAADGGPRSS